MQISAVTSGSLPPPPTARSRVGRRAQAAQQPAAPAGKAAGAVAADPDGDGGVDHGAEPGAVTGQPVNVRG